MGNKVFGMLQQKSPLLILDHIINQLESIEFTRISEEEKDEIITGNKKNSTNWLSNHEKPLMETFKIDVSNNSPTPYFIIKGKNFQIDLK